LRVSARTFVFCVGAIETARLLLHPLEDGSPAPWARKGVLGSFFMDHPVLECASLYPSSHAELHSLFENIWVGGFKYHPRIRLSEGKQLESQTLNVGGNVLAKTDSIETLYALRTAIKQVLRGKLDPHAVRRVMRDPLQLLSLGGQQAWHWLVKRRGFT